MSLAAQCGDIVDEKQANFALSIIRGLHPKAAIGDMSRFDEPQKIVSHLGLLYPIFGRSGPALTGRIIKQGRGKATLARFE